MDAAATARRLVEERGTTLAQEAGIVLTDEPGPLWQLLVLAQLLSARISARAALASARELFGAGWTTPQRLRSSTWNQRVAALGRGGYRRYDFSTATRLDHNATLLLDRWGGDLRRLRDEAEVDAATITRAVQGFDGIGPTGADIFLREVQAVWPSVRPHLDTLTLKGAAKAGLPQDPVTLAGLVQGEDLAALCAALVRLARDRSAPSAG